MNKRLLTWVAWTIGVCYIATMLLMIMYTPPQVTSGHEQPQLSNPIPIAITAIVIQEQCHVEYDSFMDVPAGEVDSIIMIADILYKKGEHAWRPIYPDEHVTWITGDGDTIHE